MYKEKPNRSLRSILSARALHSSLAVVAESARRVLVVPSINVTGSMMGFLDFVAWGTKKKRKKYLMIKMFYKNKTLCPKKQNN